MKYCARCKYFKVFFKRQLIILNRLLFSFYAAEITRVYENKQIKHCCFSYCEVVVLSGECKLPFKLNIWLPFLHCYWEQFI